MKISKYESIEAPYEREIIRLQEEVAFLKGQLELFFKLHFENDEKANDKWETYKKINNLQ